MPAEEHEQGEVIVAKREEQQGAPVSIEIKPVQWRIKIDDLPIAVFREILSVRDLVLLSMSSKQVHSWCEQALGSKRRFVDEPVKAITNCPSIDSIQWTNRSAKSLNDAIVFNVLASLPTLTSLVLSDLDCITDAAFEQLPTRSLKRLELRNMRNISNKCFSFVSSEQLSFLAIERCRFITEEGIVPLIGPQLEQIQLKSFTMLSNDVAIHEIRTICQSSLRVIDVSNSKLEFLFLAGCTGFHQLEQIDVNYTTCRDEDIEELSRGSSWRSLKRFTLNGCDFISDIALGFFPSSLVHLNLSQTSVSDIGMEVLVERCPRIECLFLGGCFQITSKSIQLVALNLLRLREFGFSYSYQVDDEGVDALRSRFGLKKLSLIQCGRVSADSISRLIQSLSTLSTVACTLPSSQEVETVRRSRHGPCTAVEGVQAGDWLFVFG